MLSKRQDKRESTYKSEQAYTGKIDIRPDSDRTLSNTIDIRYPASQ